MAKITLQKGNIADFEGDVLIIPTFTDLSYRKESRLLKLLIELAGSELDKELSAIGFCSVGNAVVTKGYNLKVKNVIFLPYKEKDLPDEVVDFVTLHLAYRNAFTLAALYKLRKVAMIPISIGYKKQNLLNLILSRIGLDKEEKFLQPNEVIDIPRSVLDEYKDSIEDLIIFN